MEEFFRQYPIAIIFGIASLVISSWIFDSTLLILFGAAVGAYFGFRMDTQR